RKPRAWRTIAHDGGKNPLPRATERSQAGGQNHSLLAATASLGRFDLALDLATPQPPAPELLVETVDPCGRFAPRFGFEGLLLNAQQVLLDGSLLRLEILARLRLLGSQQSTPRRQENEHQRNGGSHEPRSSKRRARVGAHEATYSARRRPADTAS